MAIPDSGSGLPVTFVECKRNPRRHSHARTDDSISRFTDALRNVTYGEYVRDAPQRRVLVSPGFGPADRERLEGNGFECLDIPEMAQLLAGSDHAPESAAPVTALDLSGP